MANINYPYRVFRYRVEIDGINRASFSEVSGMSASIDAVEYREGDDLRNTPRKLPGLTKFGNITLRWGISDDSDFLEWLNSVAPTNNAPPTGLVRHDVLITLITRLLLPLVYAYIAACVSYAAVGNEGLKRISGALKWVVTAVLTTVLLVFVGYLTVSGVIAGSADAVTVKAAKFTMSSLVPVVGGILSDAAETVLAGAGILKNAVGVFGMLAVLAMCVAPFLQLGIHYLAYKAAAALSATVSGGRVAGLIDQIGGAFGLVLGMTGSCALLLLISLVSAITAVVR